MTSRASAAIIWNPFRLKLAAGGSGGLDDIYIAPGRKSLYLGATSGTSVSHVADVVGPTGTVYAVVNEQTSSCRMLGGMVDVIFAYVAQSNQAGILYSNAHHLLKHGGSILILIKANCINSSAPAKVSLFQTLSTAQES
ncbi:uncharacterized protein MELLADRAFT_84537 [Melampsora larici-populina 98AG31]|uniref:rRNA 2'-O-methyltransferase fibrillarin n=1 Tax=Melampsora larici-populina (strain 98AG31 / pathotype 3-4-7) TaxID=747676 RepID=F4SCD2_MELLP|nr:uncharacterized protein MELLADRAFT_84537 [Melampsora larici-populina 98AG31]EGF97674.1 hypothetical protein MELLADRAFT_84537 [Melampsora larici-populina 98AG31]